MKKKQTQNEKKNIVIWKWCADGFIKRLLAISTSSPFFLSSSYSFIFILTLMVAQFFMLWFDIIFSRLICLEYHLKMNLLHFLFIYFIFFIYIENDWFSLYPYWVNETETGTTITASKYNIKRNIRNKIVKTNDQNE